MNLPSLMHVLIVEDNPADIYLIEQMLHAQPGLDYELRQTDRLAGCLEDLASSTPDMILLDLSLPDSQGLATVRTIQQQAPLIPLIVLTGYADEALAISALEHGAQDYLIKGEVDGALLQRAIRYALSRKQAEKALRESRFALERRNRELALLNRIISATAAEVESAAILGVVCDELARFFEASSVLVLTCGERQAQVVAEQQSVPSVRWVGRTFDLASGLLHQVMERGELVQVPDLGSVEEPETFSTSLAASGFLSLMLVPVLVAGQVINFLCLAAREFRCFDAQDCAIVASAAATAGRALEAAELHQTLRRHAETLEETVSRRTQELQLALERAQDADEAKSRFLANVSHELRTPLTNVKLYLELFGQGRLDKREHYLQIVQRETERLQNLIQDLLDISFLDSGRLHFQPELLQLNVLVHELVTDRGHLFASHDLTLEVETAEALPLVWADPRLLERAVSNLLTNALNYTPGGGTVRLETRCEKGAVLLSVRDTGLGIAPEEQAQIFERFHRGEASQKMKAAGTGLGLAISREIMALHRGTITLESVPGEGSLFTLWLSPVRAPEGLLRP